jgi:hypothetical protein
MLRDDLEKMKEKDLINKEALEISNLADADLNAYGYLETAESMNKMKDS